MSTDPSPFERQLAKATGILGATTPEVDALRRTLADLAEADPADVEKAAPRIRAAIAAPVAQAGEGR